MDRDGGGVNIQDQYLGRARKDRAWLTVILNSGKKIGGRIVSFDRYTVILEDRGAEQMVFKHAIATVSVSRSFSNTIDLKAAKGGGSAAGEETPAAGTTGSAPGTAAERPGPR